MIELLSDYPQWSAVDKETGKFHGSHFRRRASRLRQEAEAKRVQCLCDQAEASRSCVTWLANPGRKTWTDENVFSTFVRLSAKMNSWRWRKAIRKRPRKCNGKSISEGAEQQSRCDELQSTNYFFRWEETRTSPSWALFILCKLSTCSFRAPRVGKSIII